MATRRSIWAVSLASFLSQLAVGSLSRAPSWDEAIYLSQVTRGVPALPFVASRARGITLLVVPLTSIGAPQWTVRLFLAALSSLVLALAFLLWAPVVGWGAVVGAGLFAASWPALFYGSEAMPNLWAALLAVGVVGCFARTVVGGDVVGLRHAGAVLTVTAALMALMRTPDAVVLAIALTVAALLLRSRMKALGALWLGVAVGALPWLIEMSVRFGGPIGAIEAASAISHLQGGASGVGAHLALTDGPLLGPDGSGAIPGVGVVWWIGLIALAAVAAAGRRGGSETIAARLAALTGLALAAEYLFLIGGLAPRFLLPALALLSLAAGCGIVTLHSRGRLRSRPALAATAVALAGWFAWQVVTFDRLEASAADERARSQAIGDAIREHVGSSSCLVASTHDFPQVAFAAGCAGRALEDVSASSLAPLEAAAEGGKVIVVSRDPTLEPPSEPLALPSGDWVAFEMDATDPP
ncbi:MAG: hypothetical protein WEE66_03275 [Actinomycetota bacterium]